MAAITLGVAEVEERLRVLRRRLNALTLQHGVYLSLSAMVLAATLLTIVALRAAAQAFAVAAWTSALLGGGSVVWGALWVRWHWLDIAKAAALADRRGELADRLATLVALRAGARSARLAPVLVGQLLALGSRWQPRRLAPRLVPRSLYVLIASVLCLTATLLLTSHTRTPSAPPRATSAALPNAPDAPAHTSAVHSGKKLAAARAGSSTPADSLDLSVGQTGQPSLPDERENAEAPIQSFSGRLQQTIRQALDPEGVDETFRRRGQAEITSGDSRRGEGGGRSGGENPATSAAQEPHGISEPGLQHRTMDQRPAAGSASGEMGTQDSRTAGQTFQGASPAAGSGSSPAGLFAAPGTGTAIGAAGPKTFKLTITSFLHGAQQPGRLPARAGAALHAGGASAPAPAVDRALSDHQMNDAALRKAEIPPEYEDIVRRVYSRRADRSEPIDER